MTALISFALNLVAQRAIRGKTWAEDRVIREPIDPIDLLLKSGDGEQNVPQRPLVAIYADKAATNPENRDASSNYTIVDMKFYILVAPGRTQLPNDEDGNRIYEFELDGNQANLTMPVIARQIENVLRDPNNKWTAVWKTLALEYTSVSVVPILHQTEAGVKVPCLEIAYTIKARSSPDFGKVPPSFQALIDLLKEDPQNTQDVMLGDLIQELILFEDQNVFDAMQRQFALSDNAFKAAGLAPVPGSTDPETGVGATLTDVDGVFETVPDDERGSPL